MFSWKKLFHRRKEQEMPRTEEFEWESMDVSLPEVNLEEPLQREKYVRDCLEQIKDAENEIEKLTFEYNLVTSHLRDMEELESLPESEKELLIACAKRIAQLDKERSGCVEKANRMTDAQYKQVERFENDMPKAYEKVSEREEFQGKVKQDLMKLDGERHAYQYRKEEAKAGLENTKGMAIICMAAFGVCMLLLLLLKVAFDMDVQVGYLLAVGFLAVALTFIYVKHADYKKELSKVEKGINKLILLQNKVKIRYVNNTNLLEYLYMKYSVKSANELKILWDRYQEEKEARERFEKTRERLEYQFEELLALLQKYQISNPRIWLHQAHAFVDNREMVEIRHGLIVRRQKLRKQMEYNKSIASDRQDEVKKIVSQYPNNAKEILRIVSEYES